MPVTTEHREQYRQWLLDRELQPDVAAAILESMPPFDWSEIARRSDLAEVEGRLDSRLDGVDNRFDVIDGRLDLLTDRVGRLEDGMAKVVDRLDSMNARMDSMNLGIASLSQALAAQSQALTAHGTQVVVTMVLGFTAIVTAVIVGLLTLT